MEIEKIYELYKISLKYGKRQLIFDKSNWKVVYFYNDKLTFEHNLQVDKFWKIVQKYHSLKIKDEQITKPMIKIEKEGNNE